MPRIRVFALLVAGVVLGLSCKSQTDPVGSQVPTTVTPSQASVSFDALTDTQQLSANVFDQNGQAMSGQTVTWSTTGASVASVSASGLVTAQGNGTATIRGTVGSATGEVSVTVQQGIATIEKATGDAQTGTVATALPVAIAILGKDPLGNNLAAGATGQVTFTVTGGGGSVSAATASFSSAGQASTLWTLGNAPGPNTLSAAVAGGPTLDFTATGELGPPNTVAKQAGDAQNAEVGTAVTTAPEVQVTDIGGNPLQGVTVDFVITVGAGGSLTGASAQTDAGGLAAVGSWTLDTQAGANELDAQVNGFTVTFTATGDPGPPANITILEGNNQSAIQDGTVAIPPAVTVGDQYDNPIQGETVDFLVTAGGGSVMGTPATTDASGVARVGSWTLGSSLGLNTLDATNAGAGTVTFMATAVPPTPARVALVEGDAQTGLVGFDVNIPPTVVVLDAADNPFNGATVDFAVTGGGGSVTSGTVVTGADGIARVGGWELGGAPGANTMTATVQSGGVTDNPITFNATAEVGSYNIEIRYLAGTNPTANQQTAFDAAVTLWQTVIFRDLSSVSLNVPANACITGQPALNETIDDMVVFVEFAAIDGVGGTLAQAGHCDNATTPLRANDSLPVLGILRMDSADLPGMESNGTLMRVVTHELGHAIGFNRGIFALKGRLQNPSFPGNAGVDTHFDGTQAIAAMNAGGGGSYGGAKVPLENNGVQGQADSHWRESVFTTELMTPFATGSMALSRVTAAAMLDLLYGVNLAGGEAFSLGPPPGVSIVPGVGIQLGEDVIFVDLAGTGAIGRVNR